MTDNRAKTADALAAAEDKFRVAQKKMERATAKRAAALEAVRAAREEHKRAKYPAEPGHGATLLDTATAIPEIRGYTPPTVVTFEKMIDGRRYSYAAVRFVRPYAPGAVCWSVSGQGIQSRGMTWERLMEFAGGRGRATLCVSTMAEYIGVGQ